MFTIITIEGLEVELDLQDVDYIEVADEGLTDGDYLEAEQYNLVMEDGSEYLLNVKDNQYYIEYLYDLFVTM